MPADFYRGSRPKPDLVEDGPLIDVFVATSVDHEDHLAAAGQVARPPVQLVALVDTGASISVIPMSAAQALDLKPVSWKMVAGYDGVVRRHAVFEVRLISAQGDVPMKVRPIGLADTDRPVDAVLGRDALAQCLLRYDGFHGRFDLAIVGP